MKTKDENFNCQHSDIKSGSQYSILNKLEATVMYRHSEFCGRTGYVELASWTPRGNLHSVHVVFENDDGSIERVEMQAGTVKLIVKNIFTDTE